MQAMSCDRQSQYQGWQQNIPQGSCYKFNVVWDRLHIRSRRSGNSSCPQPGHHVCPLPDAESNSCVKQVQGSSSKCEKNFECASQPLTFYSDDNWLVIKCDQDSRWILTLHQGVETPHDSCFAEVPVDWLQASCRGWAGRATHHLFWWCFFHSRTWQLLDTRWFKQLQANCMCQGSSAKVLEELGLLCGHLDFKKLREEVSLWLCKNVTTITSILLPYLKVMNCFVSLLQEHKANIQGH